MRQQHDSEIQEFNDRWEYTLFKLSETSKKIEDDLRQQQDYEMGLLEDEIQQMSLANVKFSSGLLNKFHKLKYLVKAKNYSEAKELQADIKEQEQKEINLAAVKLEEKIEKLRKKKRKKHADEYSFIKARLEKSINTKLKQRMVEYEKLLLRIQNCHNDMSSRQSIEFGKIQSIHAKLLLKYSLSLDNLCEENDLIKDLEQDVIHEEDEPDMQSTELSPRENVLMEHQVNLNITPNQNQKLEKRQTQLEKADHGKNHKKNEKMMMNEEEEAEKENVGFNSQGQINGYWNKQIIKDLKPSTVSEMKDSLQLDFSKDTEPMLSNFHRIPTDHITDENSVESHSSVNSQSSSGSSSSESESDSSDDSDSDSD